MGVPTDALNAGEWHDVVVRFHGPNLEMFIDGVLVDEEWPHGELHRLAGLFILGAGYVGGKLQPGFQGEVDRLALWDRALTDGELTLLAGGDERVARRETEILGPLQASMQYWKPRGHNAFAGDCIPFFRDGVLHLFWLYDRRHHGSKWGQGAHQYAHATTTDLVHWERHPLAVPIIRQWECSMGTCDAIWHDGVTHVFYTDCGSRCEYRDKPQRGSWIFAATSTDGVHFHKDLKPIVPGGDCDLFQDPATGLFHLVRGGGNRLVSSDLRNWEEVPGEFVERAPGTSAECPNHFEWNGWYYFILGRNALWRSRGALGPWEPISPTVYDGLMVPKVAEFTGNRRLLAGFLEWPGWGGNVIFRELVQHPDGSLGMKWPEEMVPASGAPSKLTLTALTQGASGDAARVRIQSAGELELAALSPIPHNARIRLRVVPQGTVEALGVCVRGEGRYEEGCELRIEPQRRRVQLGSPQEAGLAPESTGPWWAGHDHAIDDVAGLDRPFTLDIVVKDRIVDACIDGRRTIITRRHRELAGDNLFLFVKGGEVTFEAIDARPLVD